MFVSYKFCNFLNNKFNFLEYELTDSEFGMVSGVVAHESWISGVVEIGIAVIQEYSRRNLNVAANLAVAFVWYNKLYPHVSIQQIIGANKKDNPLSPPYEEDLQKYLVLL
jgi:hypothetical protein